MNKKKILVLAVSVCLVAILAIGGTLAYFTDTEEATNTFTMGGVSIDLYETIEGTNTHVEALEYDDVVPGVSYHKDPTVDNDGNSNAWVRVNVTLTNCQKLVAAASKHGINDLSTIFAGHDENLWERAGIKNNTDGSITYSYYYKNVLEAGDSTGPLFTSVTIPAAFTGDDLNGIDEFKIIVTADAIQEKPFTTPAAAFTAFDKAQAA